MVLQETYANLYNEITQPDKVFVATQYFRTRWVPLLGTALSWLIIALRQHCYRNRGNGEKRDWCLVSQGELAQEIGVEPRTVRRLLQHEHAGKFIVEVKNRYDGNPGKRMGRKSLYRIRMNDPLVPEDGERLKNLCGRVLHASEGGQTGGGTPPAPVHWRGADLTVPRRNHLTMRRHDGIEGDHGG